MGVSMRTKGKHTSWEKISIMRSTTLLALGTDARGFEKTFQRVRVHRHQHLPGGGSLENCGFGTASDGKDLDFL